MASELKMILSLVDNFTGQLTGADTKLASFGRQVDTTIMTVRRLAGAFAAVMFVDQVKRWVESSIEFGDQVTNMAHRMGMSTDEVQRWSFVAQQSGTTVDTLQRYFRQMSLEATKTDSMLQKFGITTKDTNGALRSGGDIFKDTILRLADMGNATERTAAAQKLFGRGAGEVLAIVGEGKEKIKGMFDELERGGLIMDSETVRALDETKKATDELKLRMSILSGELASYLTPGIKRFTKEVTEFLAVWRNTFAESDDKPKTLSDFNSNLKDVIKTFEANVVAAKAAKQATVDYMDQFGEVQTVKIEDAARKIKGLQWIAGINNQGVGQETSANAGGDAADLLAEKSRAAAGALKENQQAEMANLRSMVKAFDIVKQQSDLHSKQIAGVTGAVAKEAEWEIRTAQDVAAEKARIDKENYDFRMMLHEHFIAEMEREQQYAVTLGQAFASGIGKGAAGLKEFFKNQLVTLVGFLEKEVLALQIDAAVKAAMLWNPGFLIKSGLIAAGFEAVKAGIQSFAIGGFDRPGMALVGEHGPELRYMPGGGQIFNNTETRSMLDNSNRSSNITVNLYNADRSTAETMRTEIRSGRGERLLQDLNQRLRR